MIKNIVKSGFLDEKKSQRNNYLKNTKGSGTIVVPEFLFKIKYCSNHKYYNKKLDLLGET